MLSRQIRARAPCEELEQTLQRTYLQMETPGYQKLIRSLLGGVSRMASRRGQV